MRKNSLTAIEGSRRASARHGSAKAALQCTLPEPRPDGEPRLGSALQQARQARWKKLQPFGSSRPFSVTATMSAPQRRRGTVGGSWKGAATRALRSHSTRSTLEHTAVEVSLRVGRHACTHDSLTHYTAWTASPTPYPHRRRQGKAAHMSGYL